MESKFEASNIIAPDRSSRISFESKSTAEIRKSLENLDERKSIPPPVLSKKPSVPIKKSPTVGSVAANIFAGLKQKSKNERMSHHDSLDGVGASKSYQINDPNDKNASIHKDDTEFDQVERSSMLPDLRAGRAKAPKRRLPSSNSVNLSDPISYPNGDTISPASSTAQTADGNKSDEDLARPKPREWEKNRVPWMDELKASQARKTSPGIESRLSDSTLNKSIDESEKIVSASHKIKSEQNAFDIRSNSVDIKTSTSSILTTPATTKINDNDNAMNKPITSPLATKISISETATTVNIDDNSTTNSITAPSIVGVRGRPTSVTLRNTNISPITRQSKSIIDNGTTLTTSTATITSKTTSQIDQNDTIGGNGNSTTTVTVTSDNVCSRVVELELRVQKLEKIVQKQSATIDELLKTLKDESDKVKTLKYELDKYAQCVTQV